MARQVPEVTTRETELAVLAAFHDLARSYRNIIRAEFECAYVRPNWAAA